MFLFQGSLRCLILKGNQLLVVNSEYFKRNDLNEFKIFFPTIRIFDRGSHSLHKKVTPLTFQTFVFTIRCQFPFLILRFFEVHSSYNKVKANAVDSWGFNNQTVKSIMTIRHTSSHEQTQSFEPVFHSAPERTLLTVEWHSKIGVDRTVKVDFPAKVFVDSLSHYF